MASINCRFFTAIEDGAAIGKVKIGSVLELIPEPTNPADKNAVALYMDGDKVGYIGNSDKTVIPETLTATEVLQRWLNNPKCACVSGLVVHEDFFTNSAGKQQRRFCVEAFLVPVRNVQKKTVQALRYNVGGLSAQNPQKAKLKGDITRCLDAGEEIKIPIVIGKLTVGSQTSYKVFFPGNTSAGAAAGEITDHNQALYDALDASSTVKGTVVANGDKNSYIIEVYPDNRGIDDFYPDIDAATARCVQQVSQLEPKVQHMVKSGFSDETIKKVLSQMPTLGSLQANVPSPKQKYIQKSGTNLSDVVSYMLFGKLVRLVGEKGSGKNTLVETACWLLNRPLCRVQGSSELDKLDILGSRTLKDGTTGFELSAMLATLRDDGIVVVDEANTVRPDVLTLLHSLTDGARSIDVPGYGPVQMGPHACILYTLNEDYVGTGEMNPATIDRGPSLIVEQESDMSALLAASVPNADPKNIETCCKVSDSIRKAIRDSGTLTCDAITIRGYIDALQCAQFIPLKRALIQNVANKAQTASERKSMEDIIHTFCD